MAKRKAARAATQAKTTAPKKAARKAATTKGSARKAKGNAKAAKARPAPGRAAARKAAPAKKKAAPPKRTAVKGKAAPARRPAVKAKAAPARKAAPAAKGAPARKMAAAPKAVPARKAAPAPAKAAARKPAAKTPSLAERKAPSLDRARRVVLDDDIVLSPPSTLDMDRTASAARSGRRALHHRLEGHNETGPGMTGGDVDADWESAYSVGDEAPGGDNPTPDQDIVDDIGRALGNEYQDNEPLKGADKIAQRDKHRWELDPGSKEDFDDREVEVDLALEDDDLGDEDEEL